jgi:hypothetical protein
VARALTLGAGVAVAIAAASTLVLTAGQAVALAAGFAAGAVARNGAERRGWMAEPPHAHGRGRGSGGGVAGVAG